MKFFSLVLCLAYSLIFSCSVSAGFFDGTFTLKSIADEKIVAIATHEVDGAAILSGTPVRLTVTIVNEVSGLVILESQQYEVSLPSGTPEVIIGNNNIGRLKASFDSDNDQLKLRFSIKVEDLTLDTSSSYQPSQPFDIAALLDAIGDDGPQDQFRVVFYTELSDVVINNRGVVNTGVITITSVIGDGTIPNQ